ncbi:MAG: type II toxin-antitoxin system VapC family toxin [Amphiplicatus sp.]
MLLVDTNGLLWITTGPNELGRKAHRRVAKALSQQRARFSAISVWEFAVLARKRRLLAEISAERWRLDLIEAGFQEIPLDGAMAARAENVVGLHSDPADRFIAATADILKAELMTADDALLVWAGKKGVDARL